MKSHGETDENYTGRSWKAHGALDQTVHTYFFVPGLRFMEKS